MGCVSVDTPLLDAIAQMRVDFDPGVGLPFVAVARECYQQVMVEVDAVNDALERQMLAPHALTMARHLMAYDMVVVDDLPEDVDWQWRSYLPDWSTTDV